MAMIFSPLFTLTPPRLTFSRTKRGFENWTGEMNLRNSLIARLARLQSSSSQSRSAGISDKLIDRSADKVCGRLGARAQQQKNHRNHFTRADAPAFFLDPDKLLRAGPRRHPREQC
ncbi:hypothetical protein [Cupriavidus necator]